MSNMLKEILTDKNGFFKTFVIFAFFAVGVRFGWIFGSELFNS